MTDENNKFRDDSRLYVPTKLTSQPDNKSLEVENLKRQNRTLEEKLKKQKQAERPFDQMATRQRSKVRNLLKLLLHKNSWKTDHSTQ